MKVILGQRWYYRLLPRKDNDSEALLTHIDEESGNSCLFVSYELGKERLFTAFKDYLSYAKYTTGVARTMMCFYELISSSRPQKPRFDIDVSDQSIDFDSLIEHVIEAISQVMKDLNLEFNLTRNLLMYDSSSKDKMSRHIVIGGYYHQNNDEAKRFYDLVLEKMPEEFRSVVDSGVYSSRQQFRILGNHKFRSGRYKRFMDKFTFKGETITHQYPVHITSHQQLYTIQLQESLLTEITYCTKLVLPEIEDSSEDRRRSNRSHGYDYEDLTDREIELSLELLKTKMGIDVNSDRSPFTYHSCDSCMILLKRRFRSYCVICNRYHDNENPFLIVVGDVRTVYFHCRRCSNSKKLLLGYIIPLDEEEVIDSIAPQDLQTNQEVTSDISLQHSIDFIPSGDTLSTPRTQQQQLSDAHSQFKLTSTPQRHDLSFKPICKNRYEFNTFDDIFTQVTVPKSMSWIPGLPRKK
uniref:Uncharacterized protein n=1 Tax=viral metagenome TaxID=1070528 RepID=A0A6C0BNG4_9ZZZZ